MSPPSYFCFCPSALPGCTFTRWPPLQLQLWFHPALERIRFRRGWAWDSWQPLGKIFRSQEEGSDWVLLSQNFSFPWALWTQLTYQSKHKAGLTRQTSVSLSLLGDFRRAGWWGHRERQYHVEAWFRVEVREGQAGKRQARGEPVGQSESAWGKQAVAAARPRSQVQGDLSQFCALETPLATCSPVSGHITALTSHQELPCCGSPIEGALLLVMTLI